MHRTRKQAQQSTIWARDLIQVANEASLVPFPYKAEVARSEVSPLYIYLAALDRHGINGRWHERSVREANFHMCTGYPAQVLALSQNILFMPERC